MHAVSLPAPGLLAKLGQPWRMGESVGRHRGFTLLETLVCGFLISCVLLAVAGLFAGSARALRHVSNQAQAGSLATQALERCRALGCSRLNMGTMPLAPTTLDGVEFRGLQEISAQPGTPSQLLKRVRVTVTWKYYNRPQQLVRESWLSAIKS